MGSIQLLDKTRKIGKFLHNNSESMVIFDDICKVLGEIVGSNTLVISKKGKILGAYACDDIAPIEEFMSGEVSSFIDVDLNERFLSVLSTKENINLETLGFEITDISAYTALVTPIEISGERLGTLFLYKSADNYDIDDIILCEYGTTVIGLEMLRAVSEETAEETRKKSVVQGAFATLSYSELDAILRVFEELRGMEGMLVASKVADRAGITRSVIVNALRKFESAGVIESRSSGMKGTYIKVLNDAVYEELESIRRNR